jgi:hypothetical protein
MERSNKALTTLKGHIKPSALARLVAGGVCSVWLAIRHKPVIWQPVPGRHIVIYSHQDYPKQFV